MTHSTFFLIGNPIKNHKSVSSFLKWYEIKHHQKQRQDRILWGWSLVAASTILLGTACSMMYFSSHKTVVLQAEEPPAITLDLSADLIPPPSASPPVPPQPQMVEQPEIQPLQNEPLPFDVPPAPNAEINVPKVQKIQKIQPKPIPTPQRPVQQVIKQTAPAQTTPATNTTASLPSTNHTKSLQTASTNNSISPINWQNQLISKLERLKHYPADAEADKQEGTPSVKITIDRGGHVLSATLVKSSGHSLLDKEAVALVHRANPLPAPPDSIKGNSITITVPVQFYLP